MKGWGFGSVYESALGATTEFFFFSCVGESLSLLSYVSSADVKLFLNTTFLFYVLDLAVVLLVSDCVRWVVVVGIL